MAITLKNDLLIQQSNRKLYKHIILKPVRPKNILRYKEVEKDLKIHFVLISSSEIIKMVVTFTARFSMLLS